MFSRDERCEMDTVMRIPSGNRVNGVSTRRRNVGTAARLAVHNTVLVREAVTLQPNDFMIEK